MEVRTTLVPGCNWFPKDYLPPKSMKSEPVVRKHTVARMVPMTANQFNCAWDKVVEALHDRSLTAHQIMDEFNLGRGFVQDRLAFMYRNGLVSRTADSTGMIRGRRFIYKINEEK